MWAGSDSWPRTLDTNDPGLDFPSGAGLGFLRILEWNNFNLASPDLVSSVTSGIRLTILVGVSMSPGGNHPSETATIVPGIE
jgi:hypothetical protein